VSQLTIGVPKEIKDGEFRVAMTPAGVMTLAGEGHRVLVEQGAGFGSGLPDEEYVEAGATIAPTAEQVWDSAELVVKVKEPLEAERQFLSPGKTLFAYLHLASAPELTQALRTSGVTAIAYETVEVNGKLPLLTPMSEIAGKMAVQAAAQCLEKKNGGRGTLLGGVPGVPPAEVVVIGCGIVGLNAVKIALGMGAQVTIIDIDHDRLKYLDDIMHGRVITVYSNEYTIRRACSYADAIIGAALLAGRRAPVILRERHVKLMKPGSVIVDVAIDQGGCVETSRPTSHSEPTYMVHNVVHYCVPNIPGAVPRSSTFALTNATLPYVRALAEKGVKRSLEEDPALRLGLNVAGWQVTHPGVAEALGMPVADALEVVLRGM
jgi:alanine dehydrogenase